METKDHWQLANWLLFPEEGRLPSEFATGLRIGSILPDCNPFTFLRGLRGRQGLHGHNAEITEPRINRLLSAAARPGEANFACGIRLGSALHYLADAFTYPHHAYYPGTLAEHVSYERSLHRVLTECVADRYQLIWTEAPDFPAYLHDMLARYVRCRKSEHSDCRFITHMCGLAFGTVLHCRMREEIHYESSDYHRPIPAVR